MPSVTELAKATAGSSEGLVEWANRVGLEGKTLAQARSGGLSDGNRLHAELQRLVLGASRQLGRHRLAVAGAREAAHADGHAVLNQSGGVGGAHHLIQQRRQANTRDRDQRACPAG